MFYVEDVAVIPAPEFLSVYLWQTALLVHGILSLQQMSIYVPSTYAADSLTTKVVER